MAFLPRAWCLQTIDNEFLCDPYRYLCAKHNCHFENDYSHTLADKHPSSYNDINFMRFLERF